MITYVLLTLFMKTRSPADFPLIEAALADRSNIASR
jgi:hypothetical protein